MYTRILAGLALAMTSCALIAADAGPPLVADRPESQAERWLQLQREGNAASLQRVQAATPAEREQAMQRLLDSYAYPIPEYFGQEEGGSFER